MGEMQISQQRQVKINKPSARAQRGLVMSQKSDILPGRAMAMAKDNSQPVTPLLRTVI